MIVDMSTTNKPQWLDNSQYKGYAEALITEQLDAKSNISKTGIKNLADKIQYHREGGTTAKGKLVNTKYLLGAMSNISKPLVDAIMALNDAPSAKSSADF